MAPGQFDGGIGRQIIIHRIGIGGPRFIIALGMNDLAGGVFQFVEALNNTGGAVGVITTADVILEQSVMDGGKIIDDPLAVSGTAEKTVSPSASECREGCPSSAER